MSIESDIAALEARRARLAAAAWREQDRNPDLACLYDEWHDRASDAIAQLKGELAKRNARAAPRDIGRGYNLSEL